MLDVAATVRPAPTRETFSHIINVDGASRPNCQDGTAAIGVVISTESGRVVLEHSQFVGRGTNNFAEHAAAAWGLEYVCAHKGFSRALLRTDSMLVANQLNGSWAVNDRRIADLVERSLKAAALLEYIRYQWVPRTENTRADELSKRGLLQDPSPAFVPLRVTACGSGFTEAVAYAKALGGKYDPETRLWWVRRERLFSLSPDELRAAGVKVVTSIGGKLLNAVQ
jgi:ribonuclease HI